jgi:NAD(P)H dehydrogenase (quinone)
MHVLIVYCHPCEKSLGGQILDQYVSGLEAAGRTYEVADLYREGFDPVFAAGDYVQFHGGTLPDFILAEQRRVDRADAIVIVSPLWWLGFPAILKGWFDRVWSNGWAYEFENDPEGSLLRPRPFLMLLTTGGSARSFARYGYADALDRLIRTGVLGWCGVSESAVLLLHDSGFDEEADRAHVALARDLGAGPLIDTALAPDPSRVTVLDAPSHTKNRTESELWMQ